MKLHILLYASLFISCTINQNEKKDNKVADSVSSEIAAIEVQETNDMDTVKVEESSGDSLKHTWHKEDDEVPWYDTPMVGNWMEEDHLNKLVNIFLNDTSISVLSVVKNHSTCNNKTLEYIDIEGCAKDNIFYLKNLYCKSIPIAIINDFVYQKDTLMLVNYYNNHKYELTFPNFRELYINNKKFVQTDHFFKLNNVLKGSYWLYDSKGNLTDSVRYNGRMMFNNDSIFTMTLVEYIKNTGGALDMLAEPIIPSADFMKLYIFTGNIDQESGEQEIVAFYYEIKRTKSGFELHNRRDSWSKNGSELERGLHFRFERIK